MLSSGNYRSSQQIISIDALRFLCATAVMCYHFVPSLGNSYDWASNGGVGVQVFFIISGYIIPYTAEHRTPFAFIRSRVVRLVPGVWICASISLAVMWATAAADDTGLFGKYLRTIAFIPVVPWPVKSLEDVWMAGPYWTLFVEMAFYSAVLTIICIRQFNKIGLLATALGMVSLVYWIAYFSSSHFPEPLASWLTRSGFVRYLDLSLVHHGAWFGVGINLWLIAKKGLPRRQMSLAICAAGGLLEVVHHAQSIPESSVGLQIAACIFGGLIVYSSRWEASRKKALPSGFVNIVRWIGLTTFPLYLLHVPVGRAVIKELVSREVSLFTATLAAMLISVAVAGLVARTAEPALQRRFTMLFARAEAGIRKQQSFSFLFLEPVSGGFR